MSRYVDMSASSQWGVAIFCSRQARKRSPGDPGQADVAWHADVVDTAAPRALRDKSVFAERRARLLDARVAPLNRWVESVRARLGPSAIVPLLDPADGGVDARILWLLEAPGPRSIEPGKRDHLVRQQRRYG